MKRDSGIHYLFYFYFGVKGDKNNMATNRIEVELGISADVSAAKRSISNLEDSLSKLYKKQEQNGF